ncbi:XRE family transcriptional regulator [Kitasatospora sp. NPDC088134]|uniref:XRE family transcriptional regulator n=1 Tax=Kitasatospora sp. NPDC088134 TaxID=3364071 RepID=UPI00382AB419
MGGNETLRQKLVDLGLTYAELAQQVNEQIRVRTGRYGTCTERRVKAWVSGGTRWPHKPQRDALEKVFGCSAEKLGFVPRSTAGADSDPPSLLEPSPVDRRTLLASGPAVLAAAALPRTARTRLGTSDVQRLRAGLETLTALDDHQGGHDALERAALAGAQQALSTLEGATASERTRDRVLAVAADYYSVAGWSAIDGHRLPRAQGHLDTAMRLSGLAADPVAQFRVWNGVALLARHRGAHRDAVAAARAARSTGIARRDPAYMSLAHARGAVGHAHHGDRQAALRAIGLAADALDRAQDLPRPSWMAFYGEAELHALTSTVLDRVGSPADAERSSHRALALLGGQFRRNRAHALIRLALAQLHQGEAELATATAADMLDLMRGNPLPGRLRSLLGEFHRHLLTLSPDGTAAQEWADRYRAEWSRP